MVIDLSRSAANLAGFAAFAVLLLVGAAYWAVKLRQLRRRERHLAHRGAFAAARVLLPVALGAALIVATAAAVVTPGSSSWPGLAFAVFAVLEYVNYFHVQLMHDNRADLRRLFTTGLRRSHLAHDLRIPKRPAPAPARPRRR
ncbi:hypothetical protein [Actinoplanes sp. NPDC020271]|uniref:hypothetical protein n=1 Tax=Actinoplanes sp. NPDC020271 TaxID=3363896 RepID=UPI00379403F9